MKLLQVIANVVIKPRISFQVSVYNKKKDSWSNEPIENPADLAVGEVFTAFVTKADADNEFDFVNICDITDVKEFKNKSGVDTLRLACVRK